MRSDFNRREALSVFRREPRPRGDPFWGGTIRIEPLIEQLFVFVRNGNLTLVFRDPIPEILNELDMLLFRRSIELRRYGKLGVTHVNHYRRSASLATRTRDGAVPASSSGSDVLALGLYDETTTESRLRLLQPFRTCFLVRS